MHQPRKRSSAKSTSKSRPQSTPAKRKQPTRESRNRQLQPPKGPHSDLEILSAFDSYATSYAQLSDEDEIAAYEDEIGGDDDSSQVLRIADVRRCFRAIGLPPPPDDFFDEGQVFVARDDFLALAQTLGESMGDEDGDSNDEDDEYDALSGEENNGGRGQARSKETQEVDDAFALFLGSSSGSGGSSGQRRITMADLKRVARSLKEDVDDKTLRLMIEEANGEVGNQSVARGVGRDEFEDVMRRAKVFN